MSIMENNANPREDYDDDDNNNNYFDRESEGALSFRDLPIMSDNEDEITELGDVVSPQEPCTESSNFEFANAEELETDPATETPVFCGEVIAPPRSQNEFVRHPRNGLFIRRESFKRSHSLRSAAASTGEVVVSSSRTTNSSIINRSPSFRLGRFIKNNKLACSPSTPGRHKAVIGLVKIQSKMEMSDIRKRQSRRRATPAPMFPVSSDSGKAVSAVAGHHEDNGAVVKKSGGGGGHGHHWGLLRPLRSSAHLVGALTKFGCISHA